MTDIGIWLVCECTFPRIPLKKGTDLDVEKKTDSNKDIF